MNNYPFDASGRAAPRLLFDFAVGAGTLPPPGPNPRLLDFACGTGWTSELLNRLGYEVHGCDYDSAALALARERSRIDARVDDARMHFTEADGHRLPYPDAMFGQTFCFDSLHHMADYAVVLRELHRVLAPGGRAVFVEPGARHASSPETVRFLAENKKPDWWIERDVNLQEINSLARDAGFAELRMRPFVLPSMSDFSFTDWFHILDNPVGQQNIVRELRRFCWDDRVIFYLDRPQI